MKASCRIFGLILVFTCCARVTCGQQATGIGGAALDLFPELADARVTPAEIIVSAANEGLLAILRSDTARGAIASPTFVGVSATPVRRPDGLAEAAAPPDPENAFDVLVDVFFYQDGETEPPVDNIVKTLAAAWYAESARLVPFLPLREDETAHQPAANAVRPVMTYRVGVKLAPIDVVRFYWRIQLPVVVQPRPPDGTEDRALPPPKHPIPVVVTFAAADDNAAEPPPFVSVTSSYYPAVKHALAIGFVDRDIRGEEAIAMVDPLDRIPEWDETNNRGAIPLSEPHPKENIAMVRDSVRAAPVEVTASPGLPALNGLIASQCASLAGCPDAPDWVNVRKASPHPLPEDPDEPNVVSAEPAPGDAPITPGYDVIVTMGWRNPDTNLDEVTEKAIEFLKDQWYCEEAWVVPLPYAKANTDNLDPTGQPVTPGRLALAVKIAPVDALFTYLRVQAVVKRSVFPARDEIEPEIPARRCIAVEFNAASENGATTSRLEWTALYANMSRTVVSFLQLDSPDPESVRGNIVADAAGTVEETDEDDNVAEFEWTQQPPVEEQRDLLPEEDGVRTREVTCIPSPENPVLLELIRRTGIDALADLPQFRTVNVIPLHRLVCALEHLLPVNMVLPDFDLVAIALFEEQVPGTESPADILAKRIAAEWYTEEVLPVDVLAQNLKSLVGLDADADIPVGRGSAVLIKLTDAKIAKPFWRVSVPVRYTAWEEPVATDSNDPRLGFPEMMCEAQSARNKSTESGADPDGVPFAPYEAQLVTVAFAAQFANAGGKESQSRTRDHVWLMPGRHALAVGFLPMPAKPLRGEAIVDPDNVIPEFNEDNNAIAFKPETDPRPPIPGQFDAEAHWETSSAGDRILVVQGTLKNIGDDQLTVRFTSGLQMDFLFGETYRWSADKMFTMALTQVTLLPQETKVWRLTAPEADLKWNRQATVIDVFLAGRQYRDRIVFPKNLPVPEQPDDETDPEGQNPEPRQIEIIVPPGGVNLDRLPAWKALAETTTELDKEPEGNLLEKDGDWTYKGLGGFAGDDYMVLRGTTKDEVDTALVCRMKVGLQVFQLPLREGWNLVSFPIRPAGGLPQLLEAIPGGFAWIWGENAYHPAVDVDVGQGMWLFTFEDMMLEFLGEPVDPETLTLEEGWNLVGTLNHADYSLLPGVKTMFGSENGALVRKETVKSGEAVWMYAESGAAVPLN